MGVVNTTYTFTGTDVLTSAKMNNIIDETLFDASAVLGTTLAVSSGQLKIASAGITSNELSAGAVNTNALASNAVTTVKIADSTGATDGVTTAKLATGAVTSPKIADAGVTAAKLDGAQTGSAPIFGCRAWVNFDATKNEAGSTDSSNTNRKINGSGNVASVLKNSTGDYTITFTTALPNANFATIATSDNQGVGGGSYDMAIGLDTATAQTTTTVRLKTHASGPNGTTADKSRVCAVIFG